MLEKYYRLSQIAGVGIEIDKDGLPAFNVCLLKLDGDQLSIEKKTTGLTSIDELKAFLPEKAWIAINLTGKGVLHKQAVKKESEEVDFAGVFPNIDPAEFYIQHFPSGDRTFISLIRRREADHWISQFKKVGLVPLVLSLGPFVSSQIISMLNVYDQDLVFDGHLVKRDEEGHWLEYKYDKGMTAAYPYKLEGERLEEPLLIPYAAAFQLLLYPGLSLVRASAKELETELQEKSEQIKLKVRGTLILISFFLVLLINFGAFSYYSSANQNLAVKVGQSVQDVSSTQMLTDSIKSARSLLDSLGWERNLDKSRLIDQIAQLRPPGIIWRQLSLNPAIAHSGQDDNHVRFESRQMKLIGNSERIIPVNEWMARLKTRPWLKDIQLQSFTYNNELNTGQFIIFIKY